MNNWPETKLTYGDSCSARISHYGAQLLSWVDRSGRERIFLSEKAIYKEGQAIRGGSPVIFPWFGKVDGRNQSHGFARNVFWQIDPQGSRDPSRATFVLNQSKDSLALWPYSFELSLTFELGDELLIKIALENRSTESFVAQFALHNYFSIENIDDIAIEGLESSKYIDKTLSGAPTVACSGDRLRFNGLVDRIYTQVRAPVIIRVGDRAILSVEADSSDIVTWNPGREACSKLPDLASSDYVRFVCVETGAIENAIGLNPGGRWEMTQILKTPH